MYFHYLGDPKYRIPKLEPLTINSMRIEQGTKQVGMTMECQDCNLYGLSDVVFVAARYNFLTFMDKFIRILISLSRRLN